MNWVYLKERFKIRGEKVNGSACPIEIENIRKIIGPEIDSRFIEFYSCFNGFGDGDFDLDTFVSIWPIERVVERLCITKLPYVPFADLAMSAVIYEFDATNFDNPVLEEGKNKTISTSVEEFWDYLLSEAASF